MIEAISMSDCVLDPFLIFKSKRVQTAWLQQLKDTSFSHSWICMSDNGWTNIDLGLLWLEKTFHPQTSINIQDQWRLLILDGHSSHISWKFIQFAINHKIKLLGLPSLDH